jgi:hypothetical protein
MNIIDSLSSALTSEEWKARCHYDLVSLEKPDAKLMFQMGPAETTSERGRIFGAF